MRPTNIHIMSLHGIFAVYKPLGLTSAKTLEAIKSSMLKSGYKGKLKLGHGGTLDSSARGVLVVGIGNGCKSLSTFLTSEKTYSVLGELGKSTSTYNSDTPFVKEESYNHISHSLFEHTLQKFRGSVLQHPPLFCALKFQGKRFSDWQREGRSDIAPKPRTVHCYSLQCTEFSTPLFRLTVQCGAGFYIRSLVHDLGIELNSCAYVVDLERTQQGPFHISDCLSENEWNFENIQAALRI